MAAQIWVNGVMVDPGTPAISPANHGFLVGDGIFETISVINGVPFAMTRHLERLQYSADRMALGQVNATLVRSGIAQVLTANPLANRVRVTVTSGDGPPGLKRGTSGLTVVVMGIQGVSQIASSAIRVPWRRNERSPLAGVKTTSYGENVLMYNYAAERGGDEGIIGNSLGDLCEGTATNVFVERHGEVLTPPLASGCLPGIARGLALEWGAKAGIPVRVASPGELPMSVLDDVMHREASLAVTSVTRGIQMVTVLDGVDVVPGKLLGQLRALYIEKVAVEPDPAPPRK